MKTFLTKEQVKNAQAKGLTVREAEALVKEAKRDERLDRESYQSASRTEQAAHDNL